MGGVSSQITLSASTEGQGVVATSQAVMLVAYAPPSTLAIRSTNLVMSASTEGQGIGASSQVVMLVAYRTGSIENLTNRAWTFSLDGHTFYVLTLGEQGTFVYDELTGSWAKWQTAGLPGWNMEIGTTWRGDIIAADQQNPIIWRLDPESFIDDDFKPQTRKVTGGLAMRQRAFIANYSFTVTASMGVPEVPLTLPATIPTVRLRFSDDQGKTFFDAGSLILDADDFVQTLEWRSLGTMQAPQRVFEITDTGAIARLDGADAEVGEEGE